MRSLICCVVMLVALPTLAAPPNKIAERLHRAALDNAKKGKMARAIQGWQDALQLSPQGKYARNLCTALYMADRALEAWAACDRARKLGGESPKAAQKLEALTDEIQKQLLKTHALVRLTVEPPAATVELDATPWGAPRERWLPRAHSQLTVTHPDYESVDQTWKHPIGEVTEKRITLLETPKVGAISVGGRPAGAYVTIGGRQAGQLPRAEIADLRPGKHTVEVQARGFVSQKRELRVEAGKTADWVVVLKAEPKPVAVVAPPVAITNRSDGLSGLGITGWTLAASGVVAAAAGSGLMLAAQAVETDLNDLAGSPARLAQEFNSDYAQYAVFYEDENGKRKDFLLAGEVLVGVGAGLAVTGVVLLIVDSLRGGPAGGDSPTVDAGPLWIPGGAGLSGRVRF